MVRSTMQRRLPSHTTPHIAERERGVTAHLSTECTSVTSFGSIVTVPPSLVTLRGHLGEGEYCRWRQQTTTSLTCRRLLVLYSVEYSEYPRLFFAFTSAREMSSSSATRVCPFCAASCSGPFLCCNTVRHVAGSAPCCANNTCYKTVHEGINCTGTCSGAAGTRHWKSMPSVIYGNRAMQYTACNPERGACNTHHATFIQCSV